MFEDRTPEVIREEILSAMTDRVQTREGSFAAEMAGPAAVEIAMTYQAMRALIPAFYVDEDSGGFIDLAASRYGIYRKEGTRAKASIMLYGRIGMTVPAGTVFLTEDGVEFTLDEAVVMEEDFAVSPFNAADEGGDGEENSGFGMGTLTASNVGRKGNVPGGAITRMVMTMTGLDSWTSYAATGGTDPETDRDLVGRLYDYWRKPSTSGNIYDYEKWALEVDGVGAAKVFPLWAGPGTVKVILAGPERRPVAESVAAAAAGHIAELRPVGAAVTVESAGAVAINVTAALTLDGSITLAEAKAKFESKLDAYLQSVAFESSSVLFNRIAFLLLDVDGITDYNGLDVNGGVGNVAIPEDKVPVKGTVTLS